MQVTASRCANNLVTIRLIFFWNLNAIVLTCINFPQL